MPRIFSLFFPVLYIRCEIGRLAHTIQRLEKKINQLLKKIENNSSQVNFTQHRLASLELKEVKQKSLDAERILGKMKNCRLGLSNYPQCIVNAALLVLAITDERIKKYMARYTTIVQ